MSSKMRINIIIIKMCQEQLSASFQNFGAIEIFDNAIEDIVVTTVLVRMSLSGDSKNG